jgi:ElaA protein
MRRNCGLKQHAVPTESDGHGYRRQPASDRAAGRVGQRETAADKAPAPGCERRVTSFAGASPHQVELRSFQDLTAQELYGILQLRAEVFVVEQNCSYLDLDGADLYPETVHAVVPGAAAPVPYRDSHGGETGLAVKPRGYARLLPYGLVDGPAGDPEGRSIGRVVCDPRERMSGTASALIFRLIAQYGDGLLTLNAQAHLRNFYGRFGFQQCGDPFIEDGIPHLPMRRVPSL